MYATVRSSPHSSEAASDVKPEAYGVDPMRPFRLQQVLQARGHKAATDLLALVDDALHARGHLHGRAVGRDKPRVVDIA